MDLNEYSAIADKLNVELRGLTTKLIQNYKNEVNKNGETLKTLPFYHGFYFIGRNGKLLSDHHKMYIKINNSSQSDVYYSLDDKELTYLTYDSELGFKVPTPVSEEKFTYSIFRQRILLRCYAYSWLEWTSESLRNRYHKCNSFIEGRLS